MSKAENSTEVEQDVTMEVDGNTGEQEVIYSNDGYRVEKIALPTGVDTFTYLYGVYSNTYGVLEVETPMLAKALNYADELDVAVSSFFQSKSFDRPAKVIETA